MVIIQLTINKPIRLIELFSGIGFQRMALRDIGANYESWKTCEWDVNAIKQYKAIHCPNDKTDYSRGKTKEELISFLESKGISSDGEKKLQNKVLKRKGEKWLKEVYNNCCAINNLIEISTVKGEDLQIIDKDNYCYIMSYSFPCTNLSIAGKKNGMEKGSGTASSLLWEVKRLLSECGELPQILLMENVIGIHSSQNMPLFQEWINYLEGLGYSNFWQDMNAKDYGILQSRNRTFMISILDLKKEITFNFPKQIKTSKNIIDYFDLIVPDKYYIYSDKAKKLIQFLISNNNIIPQRQVIDLSIKKPNFLEVANCITAHLAKDGNWIENREGKNNGILELKQDADKYVNNIDKYKIRKITPLEAFRLMGATDKDFNKANEVASHTQLYKTAGNGIVKNCLEAIFCSMNILNVQNWETYSKKYL